MGTPGKVEGNLHQGFIEWGDKVTEAGNTFAIAKGLGERLAEGNTNIFIGVVIINFDIAFRFDIEIDQTVGGNLIEHVIEKRNPRIGVTLSGSVQVDADMNVRFACGATHRRGTSGGQGVEGKVEGCGVAGLHGF
jgi:hypothetical protein